MSRTLSVSELVVAEGELSFTVETDGPRQQIWFRTDAPVVPNIDAIVPTVLLPAMTAGGELRIPAALSPRLLQRVPKIQTLLRSWESHYPWPSGRPRNLRVVADERPTSGASGAAGVGAFFSGGVDSFSTLLEHPDITHLIWLRGFDIAIGHTEFGAAIKIHTQQAAQQLGKQLIIVETNARELADPLVPWMMYFGSLLAATALLFTPLLRRVYIAAGWDYREMRPAGSHPLIDHLWSTEGLELIHDGARFTRTQKIERIADHPIAQHTLRVCWQNVGESPNCGRCEKCLRTMVVLETLGVLDRFRTFPHIVDLDALSTQSNAEVAFWWREVRELARARGRKDLVAAIERVMPPEAHLPFRAPEGSRSANPASPPRVGVVIPAHRQPQFLAGAVTSALDQDGPVGVGVVIVDDGCPFPSTSEVAETLCEAYPERVRYLRQNNLGLSAARNAGVRHALSTWPTIEAILPLDADDLLLRTIVADLWFALERNPDAAWATPHMEIFGEQDMDWAVPGPLTLYRQLFVNQCHASSLIRRVVFDRGVFYDENMRSGYEDWEFFLRAMNLGFQAIPGGRCGFLYRRRSESMVSTAIRQHDAVVGTIRERHSGLYLSRALTATEHRDAPRFAVVLADRDEVLSLTAVDRPRRRSPLSDFAAKIDAGAGGVLPAGGTVPPVTILTTSPLLDWLGQGRLLPGILLRAQEALRRHTCVGITVEGTLLQASAAGVTDDRVAALCLRTRTLFERMAADPAAKLGSDATISLPAWTGSDGAIPPPLDEASVRARFAGMRPRSHDSFPPAGFETLSTFALMKHLGRLETTFPWAGPESGGPTVWVLQPWLGYAHDAALALVKSAHEFSPDLRAHLVLTDPRPEGPISDVEPAAVPACFETVTSLDDLAIERAGELLARILPSADIVLNADSALGYNVWPSLAPSRNGVWAGLFNQDSPILKGSPGLNLDSLVDVCLVSSEAVRPRLTALDVAADKITVANSDAGSNVLLEAVGSARDRWVRV